MRYSVGRRTTPCSGFPHLSEISPLSRWGPSGRGSLFCSNSLGVLCTDIQMKVSFDVVRVDIRIPTSRYEQTGLRDSRCQTERPPLGSPPGRNDCRDLGRVAQGLCKVRICEVVDVIRDPIRPIDLDNRQTRQAGMKSGNDLG